MKHFYFFLLLVCINIIRVTLGVYLGFPELSLVLLFIYASVLGRVAGGGMALAVGLVQDILIGRALGLFAIAYLISVYWTGWVTSHKTVSGNLINLFGVFIIGGLIFELSYGVLLELTYDMNISFLAVLYRDLWVPIVIQATIGILLYGPVKKIITREGYLFRY